MSEQQQVSIPQVVIHQAPTNGLGIAGFIVSLVSFLSCGLLAPIAFILSIIGIFRRPKGFAMAGLIISTFQLLLVLIFGIGPILALVGIGMAAKEQQEEAFNANRAGVIEDARSLNTSSEYYELSGEYSMIQDKEYKRLMKEARERLIPDLIPELEAE